MDNQEILTYQLSYHLLYFWDKFLEHIERLNQIEYSIQEKFYLILDILLEFSFPNPRELSNQRQLDFPYFLAEELKDLLYDNLQLVIIYSFKIYFL